MSKRKFCIEAEEARKELLSYKFLCIRAELKHKDYINYINRATSITNTISKAPSRSNMPGDKVGDNVSKALDAEEELREKQLKMWKDAENERIKIEEKVDKVRNAKYRLFLECAYLKIDNQNRRMPMNIVAQEIGENVNNLWNIHENALVDYHKISKSV